MRPNAPPAGSRSRPYASRRVEAAYASAGTRLHLFPTAKRSAHRTAGSEKSFNIATINSRVRVRDLDTGDALTFVIVPPRDADPSVHRFSAINPVAAAVLGCIAGDAVKLRLNGPRRLRVEEVTHPPGMRSVPT